MPTAKNFSIYSRRIKAAFLLLVFSANTAVGFACATAMSFSGTSEPMVSSAGAATLSAGQKSAGSVRHSRKSACTCSHQRKKTCCTGEVTAFEQMAKHLPQDFSAGVPQITIPSLLYGEALFRVTALQAASINHLYLRNYHPPIPDIRISIQSFQL